MDNKNEKKKEKKYGCDVCDYFTSDKTRFTNHCQTIKHNFSVMDNKWITKTSKNNDTEKSKPVCDCGKSYVFQSGLSKHKKKCNFVSLEKVNEELKEDMKRLICQNNDLIDILKQNALSVHPLQVQHIQNTVNVKNVKNVKNTFNIQIFLNEKCKDAISLTDFIESIQPSLTDMEKVGRLGYVEGFSSIILTKLNTLDIYHRPIHCSDLKKETIYVKEIDWEKDENKKVDKMVKTLVRKNMTNIKEWKTKHPKHDDIKSSENTEYLKLVKECVGGEDEMKNNQKIIKRISHNILIS